MTPQEVVKAVFSNLGQLHMVIRHMSEVMTMEQVWEAINSYEALEDTIMMSDDVDHVLRQEIRAMANVLDDYRQRTGDLYHVGEEAESFLLGPPDPGSL